MAKFNYIVADYVKNFKCKCGSCRHCCCDGWGITLSYIEYMRLLGLPCHKGLRARLDRAFFILPDATQERYAEMNRTYTGDCPLRDSDGMCALQKAKGEDVLPSICKMYPRNFKSGGIKEGACAMSCEGVLECMFKTTAPLGFDTMEITVDALPKSYVSLSDDFIEIQKTAIAILQNRDLSLSERLIKLGFFMEKVSEEPIARAKIELTEGFQSITPSDTNPAIDITFRLADYLCGCSSSFETIASKGLNNLCYDKDNPDTSALAEKYKSARRHLYEVLPYFDVYMEDILVNHLFFERFPHSYSGETYLDEFIAFIGTSALLKAVAVGYMADKSSLSDFIDCAAGLFRYFEHSNANKVIKYALIAFSFDNPVGLGALANI